LQRQTSKGSGYHSANIVQAHDKYAPGIQQVTAKAIANLAMATASNRATAASLTLTNSKLTLELIACNTNLSRHWKPSNFKPPTAPTTITKTTQLEESNRRQKTEHASASHMTF
jgi:hypothetical protein